MLKNFAKNVEEATDEELLFWVNTLDFRVVHLASDELTRRSIKRLNESLDKNAAQANKSSEIAECFTVALFLLAVVQLFVALAQFLLSFAYSDNVQEKALGIFMIIASIVILVYFSVKIFPKKKHENIV